MTAEHACKTYRHSSGLEIRIAEMPGFGTACAQIGVKFGSAHIQYRKNGMLHTLPKGTAHFLEHQLFENEDGDVDYKFAALGAASNAYTEYDSTVYHFRTAQHFPEALSLLLDFVQKPYFTADSVATEREIIAQELDEALDDPNDRLFFLMLEGLYHAHPVKYDAVGTHESIRQITPQILRQCWTDFYRPQNMILCCAGNLHTDTVLETVDRMLCDHPPTDAVTVMPEEPETVAHAYLCRKMPVGKPQLAIGFKSAPVAGEALERAALLATLTLELIAGSASPLTERLLADGLLTDALAIDCCTGEGWFTVFAEGESDNPQAVCDALLEAIADAAAKGLDAARFETLRRCAFGDLLISRNNPPTMADAMMQAAIIGVPSQELRLRMLAELTPDDAAQCLRERFRSDSVCLAVIQPE